MWIYAGKDENENRVVLRAKMLHDQNVIILDTFGVFDRPETYVSGPL